MTRIPLAILQCLLLWMLALGSSGVYAQEFQFQAPAAVADAATPALMRDLALRVLPVYKEADSARYLANLSALQMVAGDYPAA